MKLYVIKQANLKERNIDLGNCEICNKKAEGFIGKDDPHLKEFNLKKDICTCEGCFDKHVNGNLFFSNDGTTLVPLSKISKRRQKTYFNLKNKREVGFSDNYEIVGTKI